MARKPRQLHPLRFEPWPRQQTHEGKSPPSARDGPHLRRRVRTAQLSLVRFPIREQNEWLPLPQPSVWGRSHRITEPAPHFPKRPQHVMLPPARAGRVSSLTSPSLRVITSNAVGTI